MLRRKVISAVSIVLLVSSLTFALNIRHAEAQEPALVGILSTLGFNNIADSTAETFPAGDYNVTLYAEYAGWWQSNNLSRYAVGSSVYTDVFLGSEGNFGPVIPPLNKSFTANDEFGLSFVSWEARYFTETANNPDSQQHAKVYVNLDSSRPMYLIGFENTLGGGDHDYQDMIISLLQLNHDVAITSVAALPSKVLKGLPVTVTVTAVNLGDFPEDFSVTAYYDGNAIGTQPVNSLLPSASTVLTFNWDTTGVLPATYTIKANATIVPFESNTANNEKVDDTVKIMQPPVAAFTYLPVPAIENDTTTFDATASTSTGGLIIDYGWNFGDGNVTRTSLKTIKHVYALFGTYTVTLTVEDSDHLTNATSKTVEVQRHDIAVTDVTPYRSWIYEGQSVDINVTIANLGNFTESVDVDLYYNVTANQKIGTLSVGALDPGNSTTLTFTWDTTGVQHCHNYTITAVARITFDSNMTNNVLDGEQKVKVRILGDVNGDGTVDMQDINAFVDAFLSFPGHPRWNPDVDISPLLAPDNVIDMMDLCVIIDHYMETCPH